jgi:hypothetical protein
MKSFTKFAVLCAIPTLAMGLAACDKATGGAPEPVAASTSTAPGADGPSEPTATAAATTTRPPEVSPDEECPGSQFSVAQFMGSWQEAGEPTVTTLAQHGALSATGGGTDQGGTWQFKPVSETPAADQMSASSTCVLWLSWIDPQMDLFYVPLKVTADHLELSYVGRGNTIEWERTTAP